MKTSKIGELILGKFNTEIHITEEVKTILKKEKISLASLIPPAWLWYDNELLDVIDEDGDGFPDEKFGTSFKIIYLSQSENLGKLEQQSISLAKTTLKNVRLKYVTLKN
jgi:hypothetical protein